MRILLVEDDLSLAQGLQTALRREGLAVDHVTTGKAALQAVQAEAPDLIILDLGLPDMDGLDVLNALRSGKQALLVMVLTARDTTADKISGLDQGADDYLAKPFEMSELLARLRALERRITAVQTSDISIGQVVL
ncbi:MAG TPA: response regulator, partial [Gammaproteobacteria bacterium]|nr:response regulator [Gammaproteobacteria bacterium]